MLNVFSDLFLISYKFPMNYFLAILLTFFKISIYLSKTFFSSIIKYVYLILSKYLFYFGSNMHKGICITNEVFKIFFMEGSMLDTRNSLIYLYIYIYVYVYICHLSKQDFYND